MCGLDPRGPKPKHSWRTVTYEGGSIEFVNVVSQSITADVFLGLAA